MREYKDLEVRAAQGLHEQCFGLFTKYVDKGATVIDLAAGAGAFSERLHEYGYSVTSNDIDPKTWEPAHIPKLSLDLNAPLEPCLDESSFDAVVAMEIIEHLENPSKLLRDCLRLVKPGGTVLLSTPNVLDIDSRLIYLRSGFVFHVSPQSLEATGHRTMLPRWLLEAFIDETGLEIVEMYWGGAVPPAKNGGFMRRLGWRLFKRLTSKFVRNPNPIELRSNYLVYVLRKKNG